MRTTLIIDEKLLDRVRELAGIREKTALVRAGLEALIAREASKRLAGHSRSFRTFCVAGLRKRLATAARDLGLV